MRYLSSIIIGLIVITVAYFYSGDLAGNQPSPSDKEQERQTTKPVNMAPENWGTRTDDQPPVTVEVTPVESGKGAKIWKFQMTFDTHSGSLDDDTLKVASLSDNNGNTYKPVSWDGAGPGGHHREGVLTFAVTDPMPTYVELKIENVGGIPERLFKWDIK